MENIFLAVFAANSHRTVHIPMGRKITKPSYPEIKRIITENDELKEQMAFLLRNQNDCLSQRGNSITFDNEYYLAIFACW